MPKHKEIFLIRNCDGQLVRPNLPNGYSFRNYRDGDREHWYEIHNAIDHLENFDDNTFDNYFGNHLDELKNRMFFIQHDSSKRFVATATAWFNEDYFGNNCGRIHWVGIHPDFRGQSLARPLLEESLYHLKELGYKKTFLRTYSFREVAIGLYLRLGFSPDLRHKEAKVIWQGIEKQGQYPELKKFLIP